jgi:hypothetical protein
VGNISFTPTFQHIDWIDGEDDVEAGGEKGFNGRFRAVEHDLRQLSTVVTQIATTIDVLAAANPDPVEQRLVIPPQLLGSGVVDATPWRLSATGGAVGFPGSVTGGVVNIVLPDRVRLRSLRVIGQTVGTTTVTTLSRIALSGGTQGEILATVVGDTDPYSTLAPIGDDVARVDLSRFRYFIRAVTSGPVGTSGPVTIGAFHVGYIAG